MRRELLQLADKLDLTKHKIGGLFMSQKLDGTRCFWDGGITRGMRTEDVPWASLIDPKTGKRKKKIKPVATGLWSRYGNPIIVPDWYINQLPTCFLDGELWAGAGKFQLCRSICGGDEPDPRFNQIQYAVYSAPSFKSLFQSGEIKNSNMHCDIIQEQILKFIKERLEDFEGDFQFCLAETFKDELYWLKDRIESQSDTCFLLKQEQLPPDECEAHIRIAEYLDYVLEQGGEGLVLRNPAAQWQPKRHKGILKYKPYLDAEAVITGFTSGRETAKGSRLLGKIGALIVSYQGKRLELAGLTDEEREFTDGFAKTWAIHHPGIDMPGEFEAKHFKIGQIVTFKYRELTDGFIPKEARFSRTWSEE